MANVKRARDREFFDILQDQLHSLKLYISGIEVVQTIQRFHSESHLSDIADRGPDNSIRLVARKPACVRVYMRNGEGPLEGVSGTVTVQRRRLGETWVDFGTLAQLPPATVTVLPSQDYATERGWMASTLNFLIPAADMRGTMRLKVHVEVPGTEHHSERAIEIDASLLQTLRLRGIPVRYSGPDAAGSRINLAAPGLAEFQATATTALRMFPVSQAPEISLCGIFTWSSPLTGNIVAGNCPKSWNDLLYQSR
jgi:hypothetical protein